ncbi:hypothetical protein BU17DRAFT_60342 [Hysterangium stoloniferum]|nr:hypothetical protein BU17DRAFT_60342 [Hysterangium stoloniferum]
MCLPYHPHSLYGETSDVTEYDAQNSLVPVPHRSCVGDHHSLLVRAPLTPMLTNILNSIYFLFLKGEDLAGHMTCAGFALPLPYLKAVTEVTLQDSTTYVKASVCFCLSMLPVQPSPNCDLAASSTTLELMCLTTISVNNFGCLIKEGINSCLHYVRMRPNLQTRYLHKYTTKSHKD